MGRSSRVRFRPNGCRAIRSYVYGQAFLVFRPKNVGLSLVLVDPSYLGTLARFQRLTLLPRYWHYCFIWLFFLHFSCCLFSWPTSVWWFSLFQLLQRRVLSLGTDNPGVELAIWSVYYVLMEATPSPYFFFWPSHPPLAWIPPHLRTKPTARKSAF